MTLTRQEVHVAVVAERKRRERANKRGAPFRYHEHRGDATPPPQQHWCEYCQGWYGVPHDGTTHRFMGDDLLTTLNADGEPTTDCREMWRAMAGNRVCACIVCQVAGELKEKHDARRPG